MPTKSAAGLIDALKMLAVMPAAGAGIGGLIGAARAEKGKRLRTAVGDAGVGALAGLGFGLGGTAGGAAGMTLGSKAHPEVADRNSASMGGLGAGLGAVGAGMLGQKLRKEMEEEYDIGNNPLSVMAKVGSREDNVNPYQSAGIGAGAGALIGALKAPKGKMLKYTLGGAGIGGLTGGAGGLGWNFGNTALGEHMSPLRLPAAIGGSALGAHLGNKLYDEVEEHIPEKKEKKKGKAMKKTEKKSADNWRPFDFSNVGPGGLIRTRTLPKSDGTGGASHWQAGNAARPVPQPNAAKQPPLVPVPQQSNQPPLVSVPQQNSARILSSAGRGSSPTAGASATPVPAGGPRYKNPYDDPNYDRYPEPGFDVIKHLMNDARPVRKALHPALYSKEGKDMKRTEKKSAAIQFGEKLAAALDLKSLMNSGLGGAALGAGLGGLAGLVAPGDDGTGKRRGRLRGAMRGAGIGGLVGGGAGAIGEAASPGFGNNAYNYAGDLYRQLYGLVNPKKRVSQQLRMPEPLVSQTGEMQSPDEYTKMLNDNPFYDVKGQPGSMRLPQRSENYVGDVNENRFPGMA